MAKTLEIMAEDQLEIAMKDALARQDALKYKQVCDALGLEESAILSDLYERGKAEEEYLKGLGSRVVEIRKGTKSQSNYSQFLEEMQRKHINTRSFMANIDLKKELLAKYFPKRFGYKAKNPIFNRTAFKAGYVFNILLEQARKRTGQ